MSIYHSSIYVCIHDLYVVHNKGDKEKESETITHDRERGKEEKNERANESLFFVVCNSNGKSATYT